MSGSKPITFAVMGDSAASGVGDTDINGTCRGWSYYLARAFSTPLVYLNVSTPGAKSVDVRLGQLEQVLPLRPDITAVVIGGNDLLRNRFDPAKIYENIREVTKKLTEANSEVLLLQLHDATKIVPMPNLLARILRRRVNVLNTITENIAKEFGVVFLQTRNIGNLYKRELWHVDRMHPSTLGHQVLALEYRKLLIERNWMIEPIDLEFVSRPSRRESIVWLLCHGTPWFIKRSVDLLPAMLFLCLVEAINIIRRRPQLDPSMHQLASPHLSQSTQVHNAPLAS